MLRKLKESVGYRKLRKENNNQRKRAGSNFANARKVGIIYKERGEPHFKKIKNYVVHLHQEYGMRNVMALGYIDDKKHTPLWQAHKLEFEYFTANDVNWYFKPGHAIDKFTTQEFDILIDTENEGCLPLGFVLVQSKAHMKVGRVGGHGEAFYDLMINMNGDQDLDKFLEQINFYLTNFKLQ